MKKRLIIISFIFLSLCIAQADNGDSNKYNPDTDSHRDPFEQFLHDHQDRLKSYQEQLITYRSFRSERDDDVPDKNWVLAEQKSQNEWLQKQLAYFKNPKLKDMFIQITEEKIKKLDEIEVEIDKILEERQKSLESFAMNVKKLKIGEDTKDSVREKIPPINPKRCSGNSWSYCFYTKDSKVTASFLFDDLSKLTDISVNKLGTGVVYHKNNNP
jgi:hypothetical protein